MNERETTLTVILDYLEPYVIGDPVLLDMLIVNLTLWREDNDEEI